MTRALRILLLSARLQIQHLAAERFITMTVLVGQPFTVAVAAIYMLRHRPDFEASYVVVGTALSGFLSSLIFSGCTAISGERWRGTLEVLAAAPASLFLILAGKMLGNVAFSLVATPVSYAVAAWLFGYALAVRDPLGFIVSGFLALLSLWAIGMLLAPLSFLWMTVERLATGLEYPLYILCAFLFPLALLPAWSHPVSYALPPYWAALALHGTSSGSLPLPELALAWLLLLLTSGLALAVAACLFRLLLARARRQGLLGAV